MSDVSEIFAYKAGYFPTRCVFYTPEREGNNPRKLKIDSRLAETHAVNAISYIAQVREAEFGRHEAYNPTYTQDILETLIGIGNIRPRGNAVIADNLPAKANVVAGTVDPLMRIAYISPGSRHDVALHIHEFTHLGGLGDVDELSLLISPDPAAPVDIRVLNSGWHRVSNAPVKQSSNGWIWDDAKYVANGFFFEEAMAELAELRLLMAGDPQYDTPVVFKGTTRVFELPVEYGHSVAGWAMLLLAERCSDVIEILLDGARGEVNYPALKKSIEGVTPGLFDKLYGVRREDSLARGAEIILENLES